MARASAATPRSAAATAVGSPHHERELGDRRLAVHGFVHGLDTVRAARPYEPEASDGDQTVACRDRVGAPLVLRPANNGRARSDCAVRLKDADHEPLTRAAKLRQYRSRRGVVGDRANAHRVHRPRHDGIGCSAQDDGQRLGPEGRHGRRGRRWIGRTPQGCGKHAAEERSGGPAECAASGTARRWIEHEYRITCIGRPNAQVQLRGNLQSAERNEAYQSPAVGCNATLGRRKPKATVPTGTLRTERARSTQMDRRTLAPSDTSRRTGAVRGAPRGPEPWAAPGRSARVR